MPIIAGLSNPIYPLSLALPYPAICLLIASVHIQTAGHDTFTFEMLHHLFRDQVRISIAAPVQIEGGGSIGMVKCSRQVMMGVRFYFRSPPKRMDINRIDFFSCVIAGRPSSIWLA